jgi:hypothetical protein
MNNARRSEIQGLVNSLGKKPITPVIFTKPKKPSRKRLKILVGLFFIALLALAYNFRADLARLKNGSVEAEASVAAAAGGSATLVAAGPEAAQTRHHAHTVLSNRLRPRTFLSSLQFAGKPPVWTPVKELQPPAPGQKRIVYCLMYAQLDPQTEKTWRDAKMFQDEVSPLSPFLRTVTLTTRESLENLYDWHVESVTSTLRLAP